MTALVIAIIFAVVGALGYLAFSRGPAPQAQLAHLFDVSFWAGMFAVVCVLCGIAS